MTLPLRIFDRYVVARFFRFLIFSLAAAALIFIVVDLIEHLDSFIDKKVPYLIVLRYYGYFLPYIIYLVLPVAALLAALFTIGGLSRTHELTAMKASGIGLYRPLLHLLALGLLLSGANFCFGETVVPYTSKQQKDLYRYYVKGISRDKAGRQGKMYLRNRPGEMVHLDHFDPKKGLVYELNWERFDGQQLRQRLDARQAVWQDSVWVVQSGQLWTFNPAGMTYRRLRQEPCDYLGFLPADLVKVQTDPEEMGYWQLQRYVARMKEMGGNPLRWTVDLAFKLAMPFTTVIVILLGVPVAARYRRSGMVMSIGIGLLASFVFFALQQIGRVMGYNAQLTPVQAAWLGNAVFIMVGALLYVQVRK